MSTCEDCITLAEAEAVIGEPATLWASRCYEIAARLVAAGAVAGVARYGHWRGQVAMGAAFARRGRVSAPVVPHGWIECADGTVVDPTRWAFYGRAPWIYHGLADHYDAGGDLWRAENERPPPPWRSDERSVVLDLPLRLALILGGGPSYSLNQAFWIANLSRATLGDDAEAIYRGLILADLQAAIPIDNRKLVLGG